MDAKTPQWPADKVQRRPIAQLLPYARNPRMHSPEQIKQLARAITEYGWTVPCIVDEEGTLIAGHGRVLAAEELGIDAVPVVVAKGWSEDRKRAYRIWDNQSVLLGTWNVELLSAELRELVSAGADMELVGFPEAELVQFLAGTGQGGGDAAGGDEGVERELDDQEKALMIKAWQRLAGEWADILEAQKIVSTNFTKGALACHFLRARFFGARIPRAATLAYTPHRVLVNGDAFVTGEIAGSVHDGLRSAMTNRWGIVERLWFVLGGEPRLDKLIGGALPFLNHRVPGEFPPELAQALIDEFAIGGRVLDPCHGWGGRMLGFLLSEKATSYTGFDTDGKTVAGVRAMFNDLCSFAGGKKAATLKCQPFEDATLKSASYDFALTSPPYFDIEGYGGKQSSRLRYNTLDKWFAGFYRPMIAKVAKALKPGAVFALQIGNQRYPLEENARAFAPTVGLSYLETRPTDMVNNFTETEEADGEVVVLLCKGRYKGTIDAASRYGRVLPRST